MMRFAQQGVLVSVVVLLLGSTLSVRAQPSRWTAHTSMREAVALVRSDQALWVATTGGVYSYTPATGEYRRYTPVEGLHGVRTQAIAYDSTRQQVWIGYQDGVIDRLDVESGTVRTFQDIARTERFPSRAINRLMAHGDTLFAATDFGLVVFDAEQGEVRDSYTQLGPFPPATSVHGLALAPTPEGAPGLWLATDEGIAYASQRAPNLQDPSVWTAEPVASSSSVKMTSVSYFRGMLYAGSAAIGNQEAPEDELGLYRRQPDGRYERLSVIGNSVRDLNAADNRLYGVGQYNILQINAQREARVLNNGAFAQPRQLAVGPGERLWIVDNGRGLIAAVRPEADASRLEVEALDRYPAGPYENNLTDLYAGADGRLLVGGGPGSSAGFYRLDPDGSWTNYTPRFFDFFENDNASRYQRVHIDQRGHLWAGSFGGGLVEVTPENEFRTYDIPPLQAVSGLEDEGFVVVSGVDSDADNRLWVTNLGAPQPLRVHLPEEDTWAALPSVIGSDRTYGRLFVDSFGQKWIIAIDRQLLSRQTGLLVLDTNDTPQDPSDDAYRYFNTTGQQPGVGLPSTEVTAITEDRDGNLWVGTENGGLAYLVNSSVVAEDPSAEFVRPQWAEVEEGENPFVLGGLTVNDVTVDPANRLWAATDEGVYLIEQVSNGYEEVRHFTVSNSPLFSNQVQSVAVDDRSGEVYFVTAQGLTSYRGEAIASSQEKQDLFVYPNPAVFNEGSSPDICIEGLVEETDVRILTSQGRLVNQLSGRGGRVCWDGRSRTQQPVPSGVYLVVAVGENGEGTAYGKVAIIR